MHMRRLEYIRLDRVDAAELAVLLNGERIREHLTGHELFTVDRVKHWIRTKIEEGSRQGCKVRALLVDGRLAGWCGIQFDGNGYEIAIVIDENQWGLGPRIFRDVMGWAKVLGHEKVFLHLLHTRPEYRFLRRIARKVYTTELLGDRYTTYELMVV